MSLKIQNNEIPELTVQIAKASFPKGNAYMEFRDHFGFPFHDQDYTDLYSETGQPAASPSRLSFLAIVQFREGLTDRQIADAVRARIDLKYALGLPIDDIGFDHSVLTKFRKRLLENEQQASPFQSMLELFKEHGLVSSGGKQRTDSSHIFGAIRLLNRLECVGQAIHHVLNTLASLIPNWVQQNIPNDWWKRYSHSFEEYRLPKKEIERAQLVLQIGADGHQLLECLENTKEHQELVFLPALEAMRQIWIQQYFHQDGVIQWRTHAQLPPPSQQIRSPYEVEARRATKRKMHWTGYKMDLTETCSDERPHMIVNVEVSDATKSDMNGLEPISKKLQESQLLPDEQHVDKGYASAANLVRSEQEYGVTLVSEVMRDTSWQARQGGFTLESFSLDWEKQEALCPEGKKSKTWREEKSTNGKKVFRVSFSSKDCQICERIEMCTKSKGGRTLKVRPQEEHKILQTRRKEQKTKEYQKKMNKRAGVEGSISQFMWGHDMRQARYRGKTKVTLQALFTAMAVNLTRIVNWLRGVPRTTTKRSKFASLNPGLIAIQ